MLINKKISNFTKNLFSKNPILKQIIDEIKNQGGEAYLVGGVVRDLFLDLPTKDIDIEVHGLSINQLSKILSKFGHVDMVGKSFGVLKILRLDIDWSLPRKDSVGRKPKVAIDPDMDIKDAFRRRDLTINAMGIDLINKKLVDPFNGLEDLKKGILKAVDKKLFVQDPLRFFRVMQFISRFEFKTDKTLNAICKKMDLSKISRERIEAEFEKLLLKSKKPSLGIRWLQKIGRLKDILPELAENVGIKQPIKWHPEGDVFEHTMQTLDEAAKISVDDDEQKLILLWAAICHDIGKARTTSFNSPEDSLRMSGSDEGKIISHGHEAESARLCKKMLKRITHKIKLIDTVELLCKYHLEPLTFTASGAKAPAYKRLARKLYPLTTIKMLTNLTYADKMGRKPKRGKFKPQLEGFDEFVAIAKKLNVYEGIEEPVLLGRDLIDKVGAGPHLGELVRKAYKIQIEKGIKDKNELKKRVLGK